MSSRHRLPEAFKQRQAADTRRRFAAYLGKPKKPVGWRSVVLAILAAMLAWWLFHH